MLHKKSAARVVRGQDVQLCHFSEGRRALWAGQALIRAMSRLQMLFSARGILQQAREGMIVGGSKKMDIGKRTLGGCMQSKDLVNKILQQGRRQTMQKMGSLLGRDRRV